MTQNRYEVDGKFFWIFDEELGIDLKGELGFLDREMHSNGETRYETYRKGSQLHGPSYFYDRNGSLLSEAWFYEGVAVGKARRYYPSGDLYCIEQYVEGVYHLTQEYYYLDRTLKTEIVYSYGLLDGITKLFWPDGSLKRISEYKGGERIFDQFFDEEGNRILESSQSLS